MSVIIRLQGLPWSASAMNIRHFFSGLNIPAGGVHIIGGEGGDAFIAFASDEDGRQAMKKNNCTLSGNTVTLYLSSKSEMQSVIDAARQGSVPPVASAAQPTSVVPPTGATDPAAMQSQINNMGQQSTAAGNMPTIGNMTQQPPPIGTMPPTMGSIGQQPMMGSMGQQQNMLGNMGQQPSSMGNMGQQPPSMSNIGQQPMSMYGNNSHGGYPIDNQQGNLNTMPGGDAMQHGGSGMHNPMSGYHNTDSGMQNQWQGYYGGHYSDNQQMQPSMNQSDAMGQYGNTSQGSMNQYGGNQMGMQGLGGTMGSDTTMNKGGNQNMMSQGMNSQNQGYMDSGMMQNKPDFGMGQQNMGNVPGIRNMPSDTKPGSNQETDTAGKAIDDGNTQGINRGMGAFQSRDVQGMGGDTSSMQGSEQYGRGMGFMQDRDMQGMGRSIGSMHDREMHGMGRNMGPMHDREMQGMGRGMGHMQGMGTGMGSMQERDVHGMNKGFRNMQDGEMQGMGRDSRYMPDREMQGPGMGSMQNRDMQGMGRGNAPMQERDMQGMGRGNGPMQDRDNQGIGRGMGEMGSFSEREMHGTGRGFNSIQERELQGMGRGMGSQERDIHGMSRGFGSQDREMQGYGKGLSSTQDTEMSRGIGSQEREIHGMGRGMGSQERDVHGMDRGFGSLPGRDGAGMGRGMGNMPDRDMPYGSIGRRDMQGVDRRIPERDIPGMGRGMNDQPFGNRDGFGMMGRGWGQMDNRGPGDRGSFSEKSSVMSGDHKEIDDPSKAESIPQGIDNKSSMRQNKWDQPSRVDMNRTQGIGRDKWDNVDNMHNRFSGADPMSNRHGLEDHMKHDRQGFERYHGGPMRGDQVSFNVSSAGSETSMNKNEKNVSLGLSTDKTRQQSIPSTDSKRTRPSRFSDAPAKPEDDAPVISTQYPPEEDMELESDGKSTPGMGAQGGTPAGLGKVDNIRDGNRPPYPPGRGRPDDFQRGRPDDFPRGRPDDFPRGNQDAFSAGRGGMMGDRGPGTARDDRFPPQRGRPSFPHEDTQFGGPPPVDGRRPPPLLEKEWPERDSSYPPRFPRDEREVMDKGMYGKDKDFSHGDGRFPMDDRKFPPEDRFRIDERRFQGDYMDRRPIDGMPPIEGGRFGDKPEDMRPPDRFEADKDGRLDFRQGFGRGQMDRGFPPDRRFTGERGPFRGDRDMESGPPYWDQDRFRNAPPGDHSFPPQRNMGRGGRQMVGEMDGPMDMDQRGGPRAPGQQQSMNENTFDYGHGGPGRGRSPMESVDQDYDSRFLGRGGPMDRGRGRGEQFPGRGRGFPPYGRGRGMDVDTRFEGMPDEKFGEINNRNLDKSAVQNAPPKPGPGAGFGMGQNSSSSSSDARDASVPGNNKAGPVQSKGLLGDKPNVEISQKASETKLESSEATKRDLDNRSSRKPESERDRDSDRDRDRYSDRRDRDRDYGRFRDSRYDSRDRDRRRSRSRDRSRERSRERRYRSDRNDTSRRESPRRSEAKTRCVIVKNMPTTISYKDVRRFFQPIEVPFDGLKVINDDQGRRTGEAFVRFTRIEDASRALRRSGDKVDGRSVTVSSCSDDDFSKAVDSFKPEKKDPSSIKPTEAPKGTGTKALPSTETTSKETAPKEAITKGQTGVSSGANRVVELNNLPKNVVKHDISQFFGSSKIENNGQAIFIENDESGSATGKGYVEFKNEVDYKRALTLNNSKMGTENGTFVVKISVGKKEDALKVKSKASDMAQRQNLRTMGAAALLQTLNERQANVNQSSKMTESSNQKQGSQNSSTKPAQQPNTNNKTSNSQAAASGSSDNVLDTVCVHIQGLPLLATPQDIRSFFSDCIIAMRGINIAHDGRGKPLGEGFVEFKFKQDFEKALKKDKTSLGRHIVAVKPILKKAMMERLEGARQQGNAQQSDGDQPNTSVEGQKDQKQTTSGAQKGPGQTAQSSADQKQNPSSLQKTTGQSPANQKPSGPQKGPGQNAQAPVSQKQNLSTEAGNNPKPLLSTNVQPQHMQQQQQYNKTPLGPNSGSVIQAGGSKNIPAGVLNKNLYYVRCQNFPPDIGIGEIIQFFVVEGFRPIGDSIRLHYSSEGKPTGNAVVGFASGSEAQAALYRLNMRPCRRNLISLHPA